MFNTFSGMSSFGNYLGICMFLIGLFVFLIWSSINIKLVHYSIWLANIFSQSIGCLVPMFPLLSLPVLWGFTQEITAQTSIMQYFSLHLISNSFWAESCIRSETEAISIFVRVDIHFPNTIYLRDRLSLLSIVPNMVVKNWPQMCNFSYSTECFLYINTMQFWFI